MFQKIDWFLLSHFEKGVCHPLQRLTGKTNYYFWGLCNFLITIILVGALFNVLPQGNIIAFTARQHSTIFWIFALLFAIRSLCWRSRELLAYDRLRDKLSNPEKISASAMFFRVLSVFYLFLLFGGFVGTYDKAFIVLGSISLFLSACDPLPPCKGKVKEWLKSFVRKPALTLSKSGE
jgi:hypothetical protein